MFYAGLILGYLKNYFKTRLTYRSDFWIELLSDLMFNGLNLIFILIMFTHTELIGEWNEQQVLFIYGYFMMASGLFNTFFNLWNFSERYIVKGEMDRVLTRPAYNLVQLVLENMDPPSLFSSLVGFLIMAYTWTQLGLGFTWSDPFVLVLLVVGSVMIYAGIYIFFSALSFFLGRSNRDYRAALQSAKLWAVSDDDLQRRHEVYADVGASVRLRRVLSVRLFPGPGELGRLRAAHPGCRGRLLRYRRLCLELRREAVPRGGIVNAICSRPGV